MEKHRLRRSYTLAEVVVVMLVIAAVVGVSIRITKAKLDAVVSYTYYAAYSTLRSVTQVLVSDFDPDNEDYTSVAFNQGSMFNSVLGGKNYTLVSVLNSLKESFSYKNFIPAAYAACPDGISTDCPESQVWSDVSCACVDTPRTLPRKGSNFCKLFEERINTNESSCGGSEIADDLEDFSEKTPDLVLRNGIRIYNIRQNPKKIPVLENNEFVGQYGEVTNTNEWGYTVYVDIDGKNSGDSMKWQDVYPFYITLSGRVIPAYDTENPEESGGDSKYHLQVSVLNETVNANGALVLDWLDKSISFKEGACKAGYVSSNTPYCNGIAKDAKCSESGASCTVKAIRPVKFL